MAYRVVVFFAKKQDINMLHFGNYGIQVFNLFSPGIIDNIILLRELSLHCNSYAGYQNEYQMSHDVKLRNED